MKMVSHQEKEWMTDEFEKMEVFLLKMFRGISDEFLEEKFNSKNFKPANGIKRTKEEEEMFRLRKTVHIGCLSCQQNTFHLRKENGEIFWIILETKFSTELWNFC